MIALPRSLQAWGSPAFNDTLKQELEQLPAAQLPLQQGLALSSYVSSDPFKVMIINSSDGETAITVKAAIFYSGIIAGCSCSDDPTPTDVQPEYCEIELSLDKRSAEAQLKLSG